MYQLIDVEKDYKQGAREVRALRGVNATIDDGETVAIQGPTGGGKSTLLQLLGALDRPTRGKVLLGGEDLADKNDAALTRIRAERLGIVFQSFNLIPTLTALENVETALAPLRVPRDERRERSERALSEVGLADRTTHMPSELSGGQQQRVALARAIVKNPEVLLADEPTGNLDEDMRDEVMALIERTATEHAMTLIVVTHDSAVAARMTRRFRLRHGILEERTPAAA